MSVELTDGQIVRLFELCERIAKIKSGIPVMPAGFRLDPNAQIELAKAARAAVEADNDILVELGTLLR
jgi:hypothetical protein